jgi:hypothetical protein
MIAWVKEESTRPKASRLQSLCFAIGTLAAAIEAVSLIILWKSYPVGLVYPSLAAYWAWPLIGLLLASFGAFRLILWARLPQEGVRWGWALVLALGIVPLALLLGAITLAVGSAYI